MTGRTAAASIHVESISDSRRLAELRPEMRVLAEASRSRLPFHQGDLPFLWWKHFQSEGGISYAQVRRRNTFGLSSQVGSPTWFTARRGGELVAVAPMVCVTARLGRGSGSTRILSFSGDSVLVPYAGFLLHPECADDAVAALMAEICGQLGNGVDIIFLGYIPSGAPCHAGVAAALSCQRFGTVSWVRRSTSRAGGIQPWTLERLRSLVNMLATQGPGEAASTVRQVLADVTPAGLCFPATRARLEESLREVIGRNRRYPEAAETVAAIERLLAAQTIRYPFIALPGTVEQYYATLSPETRRYYRRYRRQFVEAGGGFEKVRGPQLLECDIEDYLRLHILRFGRESAAINAATISFHRELCREAAAAGYFTLFFARMDGRRIAAHSCFDIRGRREGYLTGRDKAFDCMRLGRLLYMETIEDAISSGFDLYDLGYGGDGYKASFTNTFGTTDAYIIAAEGTMPEVSDVVTGYESFGAAEPPCQP